MNLTGGNAGGQYLGSILWWKLPGAPVPRADVAASYAAAFGPGHDLAAAVPQAPEPSVVFARCAAALKEGGKYDVRKVEATSQEVAFAVAEVSCDSTAKRATYRHETTVTWTADPAGGPGLVTWTGPGTKGASELVQAYQQGLDALGAPEFTALGVSLVRTTRAIPLRPGGGVYWLPAGKHDHTLRQAKAAWASVGAKLSLTPQFGTPEAEQALGEAAKGSVLADLLALAEEIRTFGAKTRDTTIDARLVALRELKERAEFACTLLHESAASITSAIKPLEDALVQTLLGNDGACDAINLTTYREAAE